MLIASSFFLKSDMLINMTSSSPSLPITSDWNSCSDICGILVKSNFGSGIDGGCCGRISLPVSINSCATTYSIDDMKAFTFSCVTCVLSIDTSSVASTYALSAAVFLTRSHDCSNSSSSCSVTIPRVLIAPMVCSSSRSISLISCSIRCLSC